ncbi:hypothetical protein [Actinomycetospora termitidis]|uniref:Restriction endonuclease type IV Mrr domain-containing protein n=1 Tax=Actinomycetospora termitidis TaxID=3053470 RepID=A0ABT7MKZ8_9PSEU|nr:hypothetical protein [Actinomycetospora sp. Odt1-22]MDL5160592.1 hypothetical protein [Actinomycetospora sp. Odt1-22]
MIEVRPWAERSNTISIIPGKKGERRESLLDIAKQLPRQAGELIRVRRASGPDQEVPIEKITQDQLSRGGLTRRDTNGMWTLSEVVQSWLDDPASDDLAEHLHANTKFFGELLEAIERMHSKAEFLSLAAEFGLHWTSTTQLYARINWMELLGLVERWEAYKFVLTDRGNRFLDRIDITSADVAMGQAAGTVTATQDIAAPSDNVAELLATLGKVELQQRKVLIGYIPRGRKAPDRESDAASQSPLEAIRTLIDLLGERSRADLFYRKCIDQLGMKKASASQTLQTLRQMRVVESVAFNEFGPISEVLELAQPGNEVDFLRYLHTRYRFVGELLAEIEQPTPVNEIVRVAKTTYALPQIDNADVRTRLGFMLDAELVERIDWTRYRASALGQAVAAQLPLESPPTYDQTTDEVERTEPTTPATVVRNDFDQVVADLFGFSHRSDASRDFEIAIARAFEFFGFASRHLGGSGRTDVVLDALLPEKDRYRVIVDAKSSASGIISDNHVKFDALKDHQRASRADFGLIVGPDFADRVRVWSASNNFTLLTVEDLTGLMRRHIRNPLTLGELRILFERSGDDLADIEERYSAAERTSALIFKLIDLLYVEAVEEDPLMDGYMSLENINFALRKEMSPRPPSEEVEECLEFLAHELVRGTIKDGKKYKLADAPLNIKRRLSGLGASLQRVAATERT